MVQSIEGGEKVNADQLHLHNREQVKLNGRKFFPHIEWKTWLTCKTLTSFFFL